VSIEPGDAAHPLVYNLADDGDAKIAARHTLEVGKPAEPQPFIDSAVLKLHYGFDAGWKFLRLTRPATPWPAIVGAPRGFGLWINGDAHGCQTRLRFKDQTGQTFQPEGPKIDWKGWKFVVIPMQSTEKRMLPNWGGAKDGVIHYPIAWETQFLLDNISRQPVEGELHLNAPTLIY
jgi:hypothetical protein